MFFLTCRFGLAKSQALSDSSKTEQILIKCTGKFTPKFWQPTSTPLSHSKYFWSLIFRFYRFRDSMCKERWRASQQEQADWDTPEEDTTHEGSTHKRDGGTQTKSSTGALCCPDNDQKQATYTSSCFQKINKEKTVTPPPKESCCCMYAPLTALATNITLKNYHNT